MVFRVNHLHIKAPDPRAAADWYVAAFRLRVLTDDLRPAGDRFVRCTTEDGALGINFSNARHGEALAACPEGSYWGLEHFGLDSTDLEGDIARLTGLGARLEEGPKPGRAGQRVAFLVTPFGMRVELIQKPPPG